MRTRSTEHPITLALLLLLASGCSEPDEDNPDLTEVTRDLASGPTAAALPPQCNVSNVFHYDLPIYWDRASSPTFSYRFQIQLATEGDPHTAPLGIVVNGGPGAPSIGFASGSVYPKTFNVIYTDVRGVGCNVNAENRFAVDALTTEYYSRDVLSIVQVLGLKKYLLFGVSYGTVHGTVITSIAEREGIQPPYALVLEGILGNSKINAAEVADYNKEWTKVKARLPASVVEAFSQSTPPMSFTSAQWGAFLSTTLSEGTTPLLGTSTVYYLSGYGTPEGDAKILAKMAQVLMPGNRDSTWIGLVGVCTETKGSDFIKGLVNGEIVNLGDDVCPSLGLHPAHLWDSVEYPVTVPIYYFEGSTDPNTSPENARYHFTSQTGADRVFMLVAGGGHQDLHSTLGQTGCVPAIFTAIATNPSTLGAALRQCHWYIGVEVRPAGQ